MSKLSVSAAAAILLIAAILFLIHGSMPANGTQTVQIRRVEFDKKSGNLTMQVDGVRLSELLRLLREKHGVDVVVPNLVDQKVTANILNTPLPEALKRLLPADSRFHFTTRDVEAEWAAATGPKKVGNALSTKPKDLPKKDDGSAPPPSGPRKLPPDQVRPGQSSVRGSKKPAEASWVEAPAKKERGAFREVGRYARLNLEITSAGIVQVVRFMEVGGTLRPIEAIGGEFVYAILVEGRVTAVGSMQDPLGQRSYLPESGHSEETMKSGSFLISLPERFLSEAVLNRTAIEFFYLSNSAPRTMPLTPEKFSSFKPYLKPISKIAGRELIAAYRRRTGR
jgi:hypothetical protein